MAWCEVLRGLLLALWDQLCGLGLVLRCVVRQQKCGVKWMSVRVYVQCEVFYFNSSMFFFHAAWEGTWPLKFRPWLMWSGFNETQWVDWTCSFTRGMRGGLTTAGFWLFAGPATVTGVWLAFCDIINKGSPEGEIQGWGLSHATGRWNKVGPTLTGPKKRLWNA